MKIDCEYTRSIEDRCDQLRLRYPSNWFVVVDASFCLIDSGDTTNASLASLYSGKRTPLSLKHSSAVGRRGELLMKIQRTSDNRQEGQTLTYNRVEQSKPACNSTVEMFSTTFVILSQVIAKLAEAFSTSL